jgi:hypothetical protein
MAKFPSHAAVLESLSLSRLVFPSALWIMTVDASRLRGSMTHWESVEHETLLLEVSLFAFHFAIEAVDLAIWHRRVGNEVDNHNGAVVSL